MKRGIALATINRWLRKIGLVLVIQVGDQPARLWFERAAQYDRRTRKVTA